MNETHLHNIALGLQDFSTILFNLHIVSLCIINLTKSPGTRGIEARLYRTLEMLAGLLTPLAKR
jgi:hypothetical protein